MKYKECSGILIAEVNENMKVSKLMRANSIISHEKILQEGLNLEGVFDKALFETLDSSFKGKNVAIIYEVKTNYTFSFDTEQLKSNIEVNIIDIYKI